MSEFSLIDLLHQHIRIVRDDVVVGTGDDCAIVDVPAGFQLAVSTDTLIAGRHFPLDTAPHAIGFKSLAVNLSDLAAMGATPTWVSLALTLPDQNTEWLDDFAKGFAELAAKHNVQLIGGDTTSGKLSITVTVMGLLPTGQGLQRSGAKVGDDLYISTSEGLGAAGFELSHSELGKRPSLDYPHPRVTLGQELLNQATSCIDVSDGLLADLGHILKASNVGAEIQLDKLPFSKQLESLSYADRLKLALCAGDEYELCFTAKPEQSNKIIALAEQLDLTLTKIGSMTADTGINLYKRNDERYDLSLLGEHGYNHFAQ